MPTNVALDLLSGPLFYRMFVQLEPVTDLFVRRVFQYVVQGLPAGRPGRSDRTSP